MSRFQMIRSVISVMIIAGVTACQSSTTSATQTPVPTSTAGIGRQTLPPSWTPGSPPPPSATTIPSVGPIPTLGIPGVSTLPPSWTPGSPPAPTATAIQSATPSQTSSATWTLDAPPTETQVPLFTMPTDTETTEPSLTPVVSATYTPFIDPPTYDRTSTIGPICQNFTLDPKSSQTVSANLDGNLIWTAVPGAELYQVWVFYGGSVASIFTQRTTKTSLTVPSRYFSAKGIYPWQIMAIAGGQRLCPSLTGKFVSY